MSDADIELPLLLQAVHQKYGVDFRGYALASLKRRVLALLPRVGCGSISELQGRVLRDAAVLPQVVGALTVAVSDLFRDPPYWRAFRDGVAPVLRTYPSVRLWVAGCSTGEEVWSYLVLLDEEGLLERSLVYATDVNAESLRAAERAVYPRERLPRFASNHRRAGGRGALSEHVSAAAYDGFVFARRLRERAVFSDHSLATDGVFAEVQAVSCRNVLIYFNAELQDRAVGLFADALVRRGFLGLGTHESLRSTPAGGAFEPFVRDARIYRRRA